MRSVALWNSNLPLHRRVSYSSSTGVVGKGYNYRFWSGVPGTRPLEGDFRLKLNGVRRFDVGWV